MSGNDCINSSSILPVKNKVYKKSEENEKQKLFYSFLQQTLHILHFVVVEHEEYKTTNILTRHDSFHNMGQQ